MIVLPIGIAVFWLAWSNGANDNFKGVATLWGSRTASYRAALAWATLATLAGSLLSIVLAHGLAQGFRGAGLVPEALTASPALLLAVAAAGAVTILLATRLGMPTSTTHALTGALVGAGLVMVGPGGLGWSTLASKFAQPLLLSPLLAVAGAAAVYPLLRGLRRAAGVGRQTCVCVGEAPPRPVQVTADGGGVLARRRKARGADGRDRPVR